MLPWALLLYIVWEQRLDSYPGYRNPTDHFHVGSLACRGYSVVFTVIRYTGAGLWHGYDPK